MYNDDLIPNEPQDEGETVPRVLHTSGEPLEKDGSIISIDNSTKLIRNDPYFDLLPDNTARTAENYDVVVLMNKSENQKLLLYPKQSRVTPVNPKDVRRCLAYLPINIVKRTLENTTQLATWSKVLPLKDHVKARYHYLNLRRIKEAVSTDTWFSSTTSLEGYNCCQVFFGCTSQCINNYGMKTESDGPYVYEEFLRSEGIPTLLRRDNAKMQQSFRFQEINRHWLIKDGFTEPYHPQQNPAELRAVHWLKMHTEALMNRVGAPDKLWYQCSQYLAQVHNITAKESLKWKTPVEKRHGHTPDISAYLMFEFYEKVYYLDNEEKYPHTKEKKGRFLGVADSVGDALTFTVLTEESKILTRSVVRSAVNPTKYGYENKGLMSKEDQRQQKAAENAREAENTAKYLPTTPPFDDPLRAFLHD